MSTLSFNIGVLKAPAGFLKLFEVIIGVVILSLCVTTQFASSTVFFSSGIMFLGSLPFLVTAFLLFISILISPASANMIPKTIFEFLFHMFGCAFHLCSGLAVLILACKHLEDEAEFEKAITISVLGLLNCLLYFSSTYYSLKSYRATQIHVS